MKHGVVDCFPYFNEKELLELRIEMLYDHVDHFIITEADHTHGGHPKAFSCWNVIKELGLPKDKISVIEVGLPNNDQLSDNWFRERFQRNAASRFFDDDTVYIVSDCDEIIDPELISSYAKAVRQFPDRIIRTPLTYLNCRADLAVYHPNGQKATWNTPYMCMKHHTQEYTLSDIRESYAMGLNNLKFKDLFRINQNGKILECGWHFSWMGDRERIKTKMKSFLHCYDLDTDIFRTAVAPPGSEEIINYLDGYVPGPGTLDPYGRTDHILVNYPTELLPKKIFELERVKDFLFQSL